MSEKTKEQKAQEDKERFYNMIFYKLPFTNKEMEEAQPLIGITMLVCIVVFIVLWLFKKYI